MSFQGVPVPQEGLLKKGTNQKGQEKNQNICGPFCSLPASSLLLNLEEAAVLNQIMGELL